MNAIYNELERLKNLDINKLDDEHLNAIKLLLLKVYDTLEYFSIEDIIKIINNFNKFYVLDKIKINNTPNNKLPNSLNYNYLVEFEGKIYNGKPFICNVNKTYNYQGVIDKKQYTEIPINPVLYINKGGIITGEYMANFSFKEEEINTGYIDVLNPLILNVSCYIFKDYTRIYFIDHRDKILERLKEKYDFIINHDTRIRLNLRKINKLCDTK